MTQDEALTAYCTKCREKVVIQNGSEVMLKNGRPALKGKCGTCGTGVFRLIPMRKAE